MKTQEIKLEIPTSIKNGELVKKRRKQIVWAAMKLFSEKGFHKTTIRDLAEEVGISQGAIYDYIRSKEDILLMNHQIFVEQAQEILGQHIEKIDDPLEKLQYLIKAELKMMDQWSQFVWMGYREYRHLPKDQIKIVLDREREHLSLIESIVNECIKAEQLYPCNVRLVTNFIKILIEAWVLKKWDLRGYTDLKEFQATLFNLLFLGLKCENQTEFQSPTHQTDLWGKTALVVNGGTLLGKTALSFLISNGANSAVYIDGAGRERKFSNISTEKLNKIRFYTKKRHGPINPDLLKKIVSELGHIDIFIQDLGIGTSESAQSSADELKAGKSLSDNLVSAQVLAAVLDREMSKQISGRCIYIAPWAWDSHANSVHYELVKGATVALTKSMAKTLASSKITVNCIVPGYIKNSRRSKIEKCYGDELTNQVPLGGLGEIVDIENAIQFLASDASKYLTGHVLNVSGGLN